MELPPGVLGSKPPVDGSLGGIALLFQGPDFPAEGGLVGDTPPEAGASQHAKFDLRHVEPAAMFGCVMKLQPFYDAPGLRGGEGLVQGSWPMGVQVIQDNPDHCTTWASG